MWYKHYHTFFLYFSTHYHKISSYFFDYRIDVMNKTNKLFTRYLSLLTLALWGIITVGDFILSGFSHPGILSLLTGLSLLVLLLTSLTIHARFSGMSEEESEEFKLLRERNYMFEKFLEHTPIYVFFKDAEIRTLALSKNYEQMLGMPVENALGKTMDDLFPSDLAKSMVEDDKKILQKGEVFEVFEEMNGRYYRTLKFPIDEENRNNYLAGFTIDITDLHTVEMNLKEKGAQLQKSVDEYNLIFNSMQDVFFRIDSQQRVLLLSPSVKKVLGYTPAELREKPFTKVFSDPAVFDTLKNALDIREEAEHFECELITANNTVIWVSINANAEKNEYGDIININGVIRDITVKRKLEEETLKNQKIESIAILAGGIAHDFNNVMTGVMGNISLAGQSIEPDSPEAGYLKNAEQAMERANILTNRLLTFSSGGNPVIQNCSLSEIITKALSINSESGTVSPQISIADDLKPVRCDSAQISQAVSSILSNAVQAVDNRGKISLSVTNHTQENDIGAISKGSYIKISIEDNGGGISPENLSRIFDPFFSTKDNANGLGLTTAHSIIDKHGGAIEVHSNEGHGTTFSILLPVTSADTSAIRNDVTPSEVTDTRSHKILIMDDENIILTVCSAMCRKLGFEAVTANGGVKTLELYREALEKNGAFDLVIMDLTIPGGMGGIEAIAKLREIDPNVKAIVSSGYSNEPVMAHYEKYGFIDTIVKPYNFETLKNTVTKHFPIIG